MTAVAIATFDDEGPYLRARTRALAAERRILGEWLPFAADSVEAGVTKIRATAIVAGMLGAGVLLALTAWSAILAYPFDAGGRPPWSWPAFILAPVEFGALAAAVGGVIMFFRVAGLTRLHHPAFDLDEVGEVALGRFALAIGCDAGEDANAALALLAGAGAVHSRLVAP